MMTDEYEVPQELIPYLQRIVGSNIDDNDGTVDVTVASKCEVAGSSADHVIPFDDFSDEEMKVMVAFKIMLARKIKDREEGRSGPDCSRCKGVCCWKFDVLPLYPHDIERLEAAGMGHLVHRYGSTAPDGSVGKLVDEPKIHPITGDEIEACPAFKDNRCSIYEHRPDVCRDFPMANCDDFEPLEVEG